MRQRLESVLTPLAALSLGLALAATPACGGPGGGAGGTTVDNGVQFGTDNGETGNDVGIVEPDVPEIPTNFPCVDSSGCPAQVPHCGADGLCKECASNNDCLEGVCTEGFCVSDACTPGDKKCNANTALQCKANGTGWNSIPCGEGTCTAGECSLCEPFKTKCLGLKIQQCSATGDAWTDINECAAGEKCLNGQCLDCYPGALQCNGSVVEQCDDSGTFVAKEDCSLQGLGCALGTCWDSCLVDLKASNAGCDYWAVNLDNIDSVISAPNYQYSLVVANFKDAQVSVTVYAKDSVSATEVKVAEDTVAASGLTIIDLPTRVMGGSGIAYKGYRVRATGPIVAAQFNPLENVETYSNDATLLLPSNTYGKDYYVVAREEIVGSGGAWRGYAAVVARDDATTVTVQPTAPTLAGAGVQAMNPGGTYQFTLNRYEVLNIKSNQEGSDLTGTHITADKPIGVFGGHDAVVSGEQCCADHLEHQLFPVETWGKTYVAGKSFKRNGEKDYWRIVASQNGTTVSFDPPVSPNRALNAGQFYEFATTEDFIVTADKPILVSQLLASSFEVLGPPSCVSNTDCANGFTCEADPSDIFGILPKVCQGPLCSASNGTCPNGTTCACQSGFCSCEPVGDPALILAAPVEQYRTEYIFLTPNKYRDDYVNILAPTAAFVVLDGNNVPSGNFKTIGSSGWKVGRVKVNDGTHRLVSDLPVGLIAYGYDDDVSYGYTAGLNLEQQ